MKKISFKNSLSCILLTVGLSFVASAAGANEGELELGDAVPKTVAIDKVRARAYPGGKDEQDLKVQSSLWVPSRTLEGQSGEQPVPTAPQTHPD